MVKLIAVLLCVVGLSSWMVVTTESSCIGATCGECYNTGKKGKIRTDKNNVQWCDVCE